MIVEYQWQKPHGVGEYEIIVTPPPGMMVQWSADGSCFRFLPDEPATPKKPAPALPLECWADASRFNADRAHEAMVLLCRGN